MTEFAAAPFLADLRPFQCRTVDHVVNRFYGTNRTSRFLVADETGLGKSLVARGVIAKTIEELQNDADVERIDVVYVCSNIDVARQNVNRLNVVGTEVPMSTRLSLLAINADSLDTPPVVGRKPVNLVSLTPRTSFEKGWRTGTADERALIATILGQNVGFDRADWTAIYRILQGSVGSYQRFRDHVCAFEAKYVEHLDARIVHRFMKSIRAAGIDRASPLHRFKTLVAETRGRTAVPGGQAAAAEIIVELRSLLAHAGVDALEPDLIILDEFQRFSDLLDESTEAGELAHQLFNHEAARVLLLSATPFRAFTGPDDTVSHQQQFQQTLDFLVRGGTDDAASTRIAALLDGFRTDVTNGIAPVEQVRTLRDELLQWMSRTERPSADREAMVSESIVGVAPVDAESIRQYLQLAGVADHVDAVLPLEVWKSVPRLIHFMDSYQLGRKARASVDDGDHTTSSELSRIEQISPEDVSRFAEIPGYNPRLDVLKSQTVGEGWHRLLWVPPTLPYFAPAGPFAGAGAASMTKKLVFSSWSATPTSVSALLSYEANRLIVQESGRRIENSPAGLDRVGSRLQLRRRNRRASAMTSLLPFLPLPDLAERFDPVTLIEDAAETVTAKRIERAVAKALRRQLPRSVHASEASSHASLYWEWPLVLEDRIFDAVVDTLEVDGCASALAGEADAISDADGEGSALVKYVQTAVDTRQRRDGIDLTHVPSDLATVTAQVALHSPANCAWRALGRLPVDTAAVSDAGRWAAAATIAAGFRTIFNRWDASLLLDTLYPDTPAYWRRVLHYCADGNLQAVLDEYLFHLVAVEGNNRFDDDTLQQFAHTAAAALRLKPANYRARSPLTNDHIDFHSRFALRYGDSKSDEQSFRPSEVRAAFNSPFWPFVLVSTSVGQEGIDFHPWCHNLVHWNVPTNPVDFEQRDGRVNRFRGHALRRNVADRFGTEMRASSNPWRDGYRLAATVDQDNTVEGLCPDWVFPGRHTVVREIIPYQLSIDNVRLAVAHRRVALYRLTFGQPRQEDLLELLQSLGVSPDDAERWRVDLTPP